MALQISSFNKTSLFLATISFFIVVIVRILLREYDVQFTLLKSFLDFLLIFFIIYLFVSVISTLLLSMYRLKHNLPVEHFDNFTLAVTASSLMVRVVSAMLLVFYLFNIDLQLFLTSLGLFSVALAWIFKEYVDNILDGFIILFSENLKIKDYIKVGDYKGVINHIALLETELKTDEGDIVHIPNSFLLEKPVINFSRAKIKTIQYSFTLSKEHFSKVEDLEAYLKEAIPEAFPEVMQRETFYFKIDEIQAKKLTISLQIPVRKYNFDIEERVRKFASLKIMAFLDGKKLK